MTRSALFLLTFLLLLAGPAQALRCGQNLVSVGDRMYDVQRICGEPDARQVRNDKRFYRIFSSGTWFETLVEVEVEEWTYDFGPDRFIRILRFENGRLAEIETGDYGSAE